MDMMSLMQYKLPYYFYDVNLFSVTVRLLMAVIIGGIIGLERGANSHPAGFRTHILVCIGATLAMLTDQYICQTLSATADPARLGAQVITGVGFLGVGTIFATGKYKIRGLTTAAGLWASACLGLALGIGFYSGAIIAGVLIFFSLAVLPRVEKRFYGNSRIINLYVEVENITSWKACVKLLVKNNVNIIETQSYPTTTTKMEGHAFYVSIKIPKDSNFDIIREELNNVEGLQLLEEL